MLKLRLLLIAVADLFAQCVARLLAWGELSLWRPSGGLHVNFFYGVVISAMVLGVFHRPIDLEAAEIMSVGARPTLQEVVERFAPEVRLHPEERYFPASVSWFLERAQKTRAGLGEKLGLSFYHIPDDERRDETRAGDLESAETYVHIRELGEDKEGMDIQYWFFYPYNGPLIPGPVNGAHEGDWEHITVRLERSWRRIKQIYYAAHDDEGRWFLPKQIQFQDGTHPVVYSARYGHASYPTPGLKSRGYLPADRVADGGEVWQTWRSLRVIADPIGPRPDIDWLSFEGHWGRPARFFPAPQGPAFQDYWQAQS